MTWTPPLFFYKCHILYLIFFQQGEILGLFNNWYKENFNLLPVSGLYALLLRSLLYINKANSSPGFSFFPFKCWWCFPLPLMQTGQPFRTLTSGRSGYCLSLCPKNHNIYIQWSREGTLNSMSIYVKLLILSHLFFFKSISIVYRKWTHTGECFPAAQHSILGYWIMPFLF